MSDRARDQFGVNWVHGEPGAGISAHQDSIRTGQNSGHQAMALAHWFGAARIVMLGYDMARSGGRSHWHGDHPRTLNNGDPLRWHAGMATLAEALRRAGVEVVNASRHTALECYPRQPLDRALA